MNPSLECDLVVLMGQCRIGGCFFAVFVYLSTKLSLIVLVVDEREKVAQRES